MNKLESSDLTYSPSLLNSGPLNYRKPPFRYLNLQPHYRLSLLTNPTQWLFNSVAHSWQLGAETQPQVNQGLCIIRRSNNGRWQQMSSCSCPKPHPYSLSLPPSPPPAHIQYPNRVLEIEKLHKEFPQLWGSKRQELSINNISWKGMRFPSKCSYYYSYWCWSGCSWF